ncbi:2-oxoglutarate-dependent ethylene/succinate-forming enzyme like protein [Verticillium longisporum]|uniref:2-oxoglutarate-dependent ethylene/succinate-forming enzyme like protein n=1 Tax=Verticillium longisporum TaxID=100787 RepID=A0A8I3AQ29_VERLO|nr:2-oxoglutarate-dependent ethylene/succinate-forming enzyme like protein [Verticillium longisporum]
MTVANAQRLVPTKAVTKAVSGDPSGVPPGYKATIGQLQTFVLPETFTSSASDVKLGRAIVAAWQKDGILQIAMKPNQQATYKAANAASKRFFKKSHAQKAACVDSQSYAGYIASGEELTDGIADYSEIFTVTKDLPLDEPRVRAKWPCHGRCPWPDVEMQEPIQRYMDSLGESGEMILKLTELGLDLPEGSLTGLTRDGKDGRGIGSHTDYGLLVLAAADDVGALFVRPPEEDENFANWERSAAGFKEDDAGWVFVPPAENVFTVFPGDMMQFLTNSVLPSTPHKVGLNIKERFAFAYFHEPSFQAVIKPLEGYDVGQEPKEGIHYGKHFTDMFMRNYPQRITTQRLVEEGRYDVLDEHSLRTMSS